MLGYLNQPDKARPPWLSACLVTLPRIDQTSVEKRVAVDRGLRLPGPGRKSLFRLKEFGEVVPPACWINTGGEKLYATEVESVLRSHPEVKQVWRVEPCRVGLDSCHFPSKVAVFGLADPHMGEVVCAAVIPSSPVAHTAEANIEHRLQEFCRSQLSKFKVREFVDLEFNSGPQHQVPRKVIVWKDPEFPTNSSGKIMKHMIKENVSGQRCRM
eukprot:767141-Hanusia_phi.AAC.8